jgi:hypothetical protein
MGLNSACLQLSWWAVSMVLLPRVCGWIQQLAFKQHSYGQDALQYWSQVC